MDHSAQKSSRRESKSQCELTAKKLRKGMVRNIDDKSVRSQIIKQEICNGKYATIVENTFLWGKRNNKI